MSGGVRQRVVTSETEVTEESVKQNVADTKPRHPDKSSHSVRKLLCWVSVLVVGAVALIIAVSPDVIEPFTIELKKRPFFNGTLEPNQELARAERLLENQILGPESIVIRKGDIYTGTADGRILRIDSNLKIHEFARIGVPPCGRFRDEHTCGRPLGMRFDVTGSLIVADAYLGIHKIDLKTGKTTEVFSPNTLVDKAVPVFFNDLDLSKDGRIFFSDSSTKWERRDVPLIFLEGRSDGRLIEFNRRTLQSKIAVDTMQFANGVQISHDRSYVLVAETVKCRILRYDLTGWKVGSYTLFADNLPGYPDNIRLSSTGGYWVSFAAIRRAETFSTFDYVAERPWLRRFLTKIINPWTLMKLAPKYGLVVEYNDKGEIVRSLHDPTGKTIPSVSEVHDEDGILYLGSYNQPYLGKLDLREANKEFMKKKQKTQAI